MERVYGKDNNIEVNTRIPFEREFAYVDIYPYRADAIFARNGLPVRFYRKHLERPHSTYVVVFAKVRRKDVRKFADSMADLERALIMEGFSDYPEFCRENFAWLRNEE